MFAFLEKWFQHRAMSARVAQTTFCEEGDGGWNTRLRYALEGFAFIGDIVPFTEAELYQRTSLGRNTMQRLKTFLASKGLSLGMKGEVVDTWRRPR